MQGGVARDREESAAAGGEEVRRNGQGPARSAKPAAPVAKDAAKEDPAAPKPADYGGIDYTPTKK